MRTDIDMDMRPEMKILVCGGRDYSDWDSLDVILCAHKPTLIIHGGARGADSLAGWWARCRLVPVRVFPADWSKYGKAAGIIRNKQMLDEGKPDLVIAFPGGRGTANMIEQAKAAGVRVIAL